MNQYLTRQKQSITRLMLAAFVLSWFTLIGQASAHTFMMAEMQQHKAMGHDMSSHCPPVLCESVIALDDQSGHGSGTLLMVDLNMLPASLSFQVSLRPRLQIRLSRFTEVTKLEPPPLQKTGILRI
jgi:hypothetical protein